MAEKIEFLITAKNATQRVFAEIEQSLGGIGKALGSFGAIAGAAAGAAALIGAKLASSADEIQQATRLLGVSASTLREWQFIAGRTAGVTEDQLNTSLTKLTQKAGEASRGNTELLKTFRALGISQGDLKGTLGELEALYPRVIEGLGRLGSEYEQVAVAQKLFEESGVRIVGVARTSAEEQARLTETYREFAGELTDEGVAALAEAKRALEGWAQILEDRAIVAAGNFVIAVGEMGTALAAFRRSDELQRLRGDIVELEERIRDFDEGTGPNWIEKLLALGSPVRIDEEAIRQRLLETRDRIAEIQKEITDENARNNAAPAAAATLGSIVDPALEANVAMARRAAEEMVALDRLRTESERIQSEYRLENAIAEAEQRAEFLRIYSAMEAAERERAAKLQEEKDKAERLAKAQHYLGMLAGMTTYNKAFFQIAKVAAIANAIISTRQAAAQALKELPYPLNIAAAAAVAAAGFAQVAAIQQTQFGQTAASVQSSGPGGFATGPSPLPSPATPVKPGDQQTSTVEIVIRGGDSFGRALVEALDVQVNQHDAVFIKSGSRQKAELA
jgi:hypothetical protein